MRGLLKERVQMSRRFRVEHASRVFPGSTGCQPVVAGGPAGNTFAHVFLVQPISRSRQAAETYRLAACAPQHVAIHARRVCYLIAVVEPALTCSCNAGSLNRSRNFWTICSTTAASERGKTNEYRGHFPAAGEITRFSNKNRGS